MIYCLCGNNGSGKTTFINILLGVLNENVEGKILYNDLSLSDLDMYELRLKSISVVQQTPIFSNDTVFNILSESAGIDSPDSLIRFIQIQGLTEFYMNDNFDIRNLLTKKAPDLSGGEKQKVAFLKAILKNPSILILDEPSSAMDIDSVEHQKNFLMKIKKDMIIILVTHDVRLIEITDDVIPFDKNVPELNSVRQS